MKKVITVNDVWHGMAGVAATIPEAIDGLIKADYINERTNVNVENFPNIVDFLGVDWAEVLRHMTVNDLNEIFEDYLKFQWAEFWG